MQSAEVRVGEGGTGSGSLGNAAEGAQAGLPKWSRFGPETRWVLGPGR